jgi:colanic acid/amylovoran biosynthesis glycosyltransferase
MIRKLEGPDDGARGESGLRVLYVLWRFPELSQTFVASEVDRMLDDGVDLRMVTVGAGATRRARPKLERRIVRLNLVSVDPRRCIDAVRDREFGSTLLRRAWSAGASEVATRRLQGWRPDIVHAHFVDHTAYLAYKLAQRLESPLTLTAHAADYLHQSQPADLASKLSVADAVFTISHAAAGHLAQSIGEGPWRSRTHTVRASVRWRPGESPRGKKGPYLVTVARLTDKKGVDVAIRAVAAMAVASDVRLPLVVVGDGPNRAALEKLASQVCVDGAVEFMGALPNDQTQAIIAGASLMVLPCRRMSNGDMDGIPVALMEAGCASIPVVTTRISGIPELVSDGVSGLLVDPDDHEAVATAVLSLLKDPARARELGRALHDTVQSEFDGQLQVERMRRVWRDVLERVAT